jgi:hypothetical protein
MSEEFIVWDPLPNVAGKYNITAVEEHDEGLNVMLVETTNPAKGLRITFKGPTHFYHHTDTPYAHPAGPELRVHAATWTFFKVHNSPYMEWISEQSYGVADERKLSHYLFLAANGTLDVIKGSEPHVEPVEVL